MCCSKVCFALARSFITYSNCLAICFCILIDGRILAILLVPWFDFRTLFCDYFLPAIPDQTCSIFDFSLLLTQCTISAPFDGTYCLTSRSFILRAPFTRIVSLVSSLGVSINGKRQALFSTRTRLISFVIIPPGFIPSITEHAIQHHSHRISLQAFQSSKSRNHTDGYGAVDIESSITPCNSLNRWSGCRRLLSTLIETLCVP